MNSLNIDFPDYLNPRATNERLSNENDTLRNALLERIKRPLPHEFYEDDTPATPPAPPPPTIMTALVQLSPMDYPNIKFWTKKDWKDHGSNQKDISWLEHARDSQRDEDNDTNVMMRFIENEDGTLIVGSTAREIRYLARAIWRGFYALGTAPRKWGDATNDVRQSFFQQMEARWPVLRYCSNNWKTDHLATLLYSTWYPKYNKKMRAQAVEDGREHPTKRARTCTSAEPVEGPQDMPLLHEEEDTTPPHNNLICDEETGFAQEDQRPLASTQRPLIDPL